jgi:uncharacterized protein (TIGR00645 family)
MMLLRLPATLAVLLIVVAIGVLPSVAPRADAAPRQVTVATRDLTPFVMTQDSVRSGFTIDLLALLDLVLLANLILIVIFAGYENFVSRIDAAHESVDRPHWMGTIDFSGLKIKLIGSLVAISVIELLKDFIHLGEEPNEKVGEGVIWRVVIHLTFVVSGVLFAVMDVIGDRHKSEAKDLKKDGTLKGKPGAKR